MKNEEINIVSPDWSEDFYVTIGDHNRTYKYLHRDGKLMSTAANSWYSDLEKAGKAIDLYFKNRKRRLEEVVNESLEPFGFTVEKLVLIDKEGKRATIE